jgi:hypothetical protein
LPEWATDFKKRREIGKITTSDLLAFSYQIATGMIFLHEKQVSKKNSDVTDVTDLTLQTGFSFVLENTTDVDDSFSGSPP